MSKYDWEGFLQIWNKALIESVSFAEYLDKFGQDVPGEYSPEVLASGWLGYPGATEEQVANLEIRLGQALPPSYREFLKATNGWRYAGNRIPRIWSVDRINWLAEANQEALETWKKGMVGYGGIEIDILAVPDEEYFVYGKEQLEYNFRFEYLDTALEISDHEISGTGVYMLNPQIVFPDGEWEAWFWAHWLPGARRYKSFWDLMQAEYVSIIADEGFEKWRLSKKTAPHKKEGLLSKILEGFKFGKPS